MTTFAPWRLTPQISSFQKSNELRSASSGARSTASSCCTSSSSTRRTCTTTRRTSSESTWAFLQSSRETASRTTLRAPRSRCKLIPVRSLNIELLNLWNSYFLNLWQFYLPVFVFVLTFFSFGPALFKLCSNFLQLSVSKFEFCETIEAKYCNLKAILTDVLRLGRCERMQIW